MLTVIPTIDVEGVHGSDPFNQMVLGNINETEDWGVFKQAKIFKKYNISATFFIDVYEYSMWGEDKLKDVCLKLVDMGQDVQLHTHPGWRVDARDSEWLQQHRKKNSYLGSSKDLMSKLTLDEQINVLEHGMELMHKWTGCYPIAHRSGGYSINADTIEALSQVGIPIDSSMYHGHPNSLETWTKNAIHEKNNVIELPVTLANYTGLIKVFNSDIKFYQRLMKTDIDVFDLYEFKKYYNYAIKKDIKLLNMFMHSYTLMGYKKDFSKFWPDYKNEKKLIDSLEWLLDKNDVQIISCKEFFDLYKKDPNAFKGSDAVPDIPLKYTKMLRYGLQKVIRLSDKKMQDSPMG